MKKRLATIKVNVHLFQLFTALLIAAASYVVIYALGPFHVFVRGRATTFIAPPLYLASVGVPFGLLISEGLTILRFEGVTSKGLALPLMMLALVCLGFVRYLIPDWGLSSHALVLSFFYLYEFLERPEGHLWKIVVVLPVVLQTAWYKLLVWHDPHSLLSGVVLGTLPYLGWKLACKKQKRNG